MVRHAVDVAGLMVHQIFAVAQRTLRVFVLPGVLHLFPRTFYVIRRHGLEVRACTEEIVLCGRSREYRAVFLRREKEEIHQIFLRRIDT